MSHRYAHKIDRNQRRFAAPFSFEIPIRTRSMANARLHWARKARIVKAERYATRLCFMSECAQSVGGIRIGKESQDPIPPFPLVVTLTRIAPRELDDDNLRPALKAVRDQLADELGLPSDRDPRVRWAYAQAKGKPREYAARVEIRSEAGCQLCQAGAWSTRSGAGVGVMRGIGGMGDGEARRHAEARRKPVPELRAQGVELHARPERNRERDQSVPGVGVFWSAADSRDARPVLRRGGMAMTRHFKSEETLWKRALRRCCPVCGAVYVRVAGIWLLEAEVSLRRWVEKLERVICEGAMMAREADGADVDGGYCIACERPATRGEFCDGHEQHMRRFGRVMTIEEKPISQRDRLREAALTYADASDSDDAHRRADDNLLKSAAAIGRKSWVEAQREGRERARKFGARFGRPATVQPEAAAAAVVEHGSVRKAAKALGVKKDAVCRALTRFKTAKWEAMSEKPRKCVICDRRARDWVDLRTTMSTNLTPTRWAMCCECWRSMDGSNSLRVVWLLREPGSLRTWEGEAMSDSDRALTARRTMGRGCEPGWRRLGIYDSSRRRSLWIRLTPQEECFDEDIEAIELCAGREGDDAYVKIDRSNPQWADLMDVLMTPPVVDDADGQPHEDGT